MSGRTENAIRLIRDTAKNLSLSFHLSSSANQAQIELTQCHTTLHLGIEDGAVTYLYIYLRACEEGGRRTDLNDCESLLLSTFLRVRSAPASCKLLDVPHPVMHMPQEIYARFLTIEQFYKPTHLVDEEGIKRIQELLSGIVVFGEIFPHYLDWTADADGKFTADFSYDGADDWGKDVSRIIGKPFDSDATFSNARRNPDWKYFRNIEFGISVFRAAGLSKFIQEAGSSTGKFKLFDGINGKIFLSDGVNNIVSYKNIRLAQRILSELSPDGVQKGLTLVPLENFVVAAKDDHAIFLNRDCGRKRFEAERERIRKRHLREAEVLFPVTQFVWEDVIDDEGFESMILDLLAREKSVTWVRKVSASRERDGGKDLIAEWYTPPLSGQVIQSGDAPYIPRRVLVQCKALKGSVGKSRVLDIRDTLEHHNAQGYFLAVSSQISTGLTDHLLRLKDQGQFWIDWWTRTEIEERLKEHPDIAAKYAQIVRGKL